MKKVTIIVLALWLGLTAFAWLKPAGEISDSERRPLAQMPEITAESLLSGDFMEDFAGYAVDQFPLRDAFRSLNAHFSRYLLGKTDTNGIYLYGGSAAQMDYPLDEASVNHAIARFSDLYAQYLTEADKILFALVPDKGYYLAEEAGVLRLDDEKMMEMLEEGLGFAEFVDLSDTLSADSYYRTDTHWRQEALIPAAQKLASELGVTLPEFAEQPLDTPFYGVYCGQAALPLEPDEMGYLTWPGWENCGVFTQDTGETTKIYDFSKLDGKDPYEFYLSGNMAIQTISNPAGPQERHLILFRDSFGSSMAPLLASGYGKVTLIDTRYVAPAMLAQFVDFEGADVLFLYSTLVINSSNALRK